MPFSNPGSAVFDVHAVASAFPESAESMLLDTYLVDSAGASSRVFRVYRPTPAHFHAHSDEQLLVLSGQGTFWMHSPDQTVPFQPGTFLYFQRNTVHAMPEITQYPVVFLAIDTPRRQPDDVIFVDPGQGDAASFIQPRSV